MATISDLAVEVLENVLLYLGPRNLLVSVSLVCRTWKAVVDFPRCQTKLFLAPQRPSGRLGARGKNQQGKNQTVNLVWMATKGVEPFWTQSSFFLRSESVYALVWSRTEASWRQMRVMEPPKDLVIFRRKTDNANDSAQEFGLRTYSAIRIPASVVTLELLYQAVWTYTKNRIENNKEHCSVSVCLNSEPEVEMIVMALSAFQYLVPHEHTEFYDAHMSLVNGFERPPALLTLLDLGKDGLESDISIKDFEAQKLVLKYGRILFDAGADEGWTKVLQVNHGDRLPLRENMNEIRWGDLDNCAHGVDGDEVIATDNSIVTQSFRQLLSTSF